MSRPARKRGGDSAVHRHIGSRIRLRRMLLGMTQADVAVRLGVSDQTEAKYESGEIQATAARLQQIAAILDVPVGFFFEGLRAPGEHVASGPCGEDELAELCALYAAIADPILRRSVIKVLRRLAAAPSADA